MEQKEIINQKLLNNIIYPVILLLLPLANINQGVDVSDSTYSLGNYLYAGRLSGMWVTSTFLSNLTGSLLVSLPGGHYLLGANIYCSLILSAIALIVYFAMRKYVSSHALVIGEFIAIGFCWIPTTILYNYLSYLLFTIGAILIYIGMKKDCWQCLLMAGVTLGLNVFNRIPNVTQASLIIAVWCGCYFYKKKDWFKKTLLCLGGYVFGLSVPVVLILIKYGSNAFLDMITGLVGITSSDDTYTPTSMITDTLNAYIRSSKWFGLIILCVVVCTIMFKILPEKFILIKEIVTLAVIGVMLRFLWGRGMYSFRFYEDYTAIYEWGMMALYIGLIASVYVLACNKFDADLKLYAIITLIIILISPLGSNNYTYQNLNNMFLVMPFITLMIFESFKVFKGRIWYPLKAMLVILLVVMGIQTFGFHNNFCFKDGMDGTPRDSSFGEVTALNGMYTTYVNMASIATLDEYLSMWKPNEVIYFNNCPGLTYLLEIPSAMSYSWCDLDSFPTQDFEAELNSLAPFAPPIVVRNAAPSSISYVDKLELIEQYIKDNDYSLGFENSEYKVYIQ